MKKLFFLMVAIVLLIACANNKLPISPNISQPQDSTSSQISHPNILDKGIFGEKSAYYRAVGYNDNNLLSEDTVSVAAPSTISLFIGENYDEIGFIYEYGLDLTNEDIDADMPKDKYGNKYLYFGKLKYCEENIYSGSGEVIPSWNILLCNVKENVDFYVVLNNDKFYLVFEDLPLEKLQNYTSDQYYIFNNY